MAASDSLGGQFDFNREINKQVIPKEHHEAILNAIQEQGEQGVEFMPHGVAIHKEGKYHIIPSADTRLHVRLGTGEHAFTGIVPNESQQEVLIAGHHAPYLIHPRWEADSGNPVPTYEGRKWDEGPAYFNQIEHRTETDPSRMNDYLRRHSFVGEPGTDPFEYVSKGKRWNQKDPRLKVSVSDDENDATHAYHYHPGTGAITRRDRGVD